VDVEHLIDSLQRHVIDLILLLVAGPIGNLPASGNSFRLRGASIFTFRDGKIASVTDYYDMAAFLTQLSETT
jgi:SnoaL-like polyketide cyclase